MPKRAEPNGCRSSRELTGPQERRQLWSTQAVRRLHQILFHQGFLEIQLFTDKYGIFKSLRIATY